MGETPAISLDKVPLGFRFHPTDEELINHYLKRKITNRIGPADAAVVPEVDVCRFEPWDLPAVAGFRSLDPEWFFFAPVDRKYPSGNRNNRATGAGYWKATGKDRLIRSRPPGAAAAATVGMKKTLVFHRGRAPKGVRTNWIMHEYRVVEPEFFSGGEQGSFVLVRLFRKPEETVSGLTNLESESNGFSPASTQNSPERTLQMPDGPGEEFATQLQMQSPKSILHVELQRSPDISKQSAEGRLADEIQNLVTKPIKPEASNSNGNMTSDAEAEIAGEEGAPLYDSLQQFLGAEYEQLLSDDFPQIESPMFSGEDYLICYPGSRTMQCQTSEHDSLTGLLDAMLSAPEEHTADVSNYHTDNGFKAVFPDQRPVINQNSVNWNPTSIRSDTDPEAPIVQGGQGLEAFILSGSPSSSSTSDVHRKEFQASTGRNSNHSLTSRGSRTSPANSIKCSDDSPGPSTETEICIRRRDKGTLEADFNYFAQQGKAERRLRLQAAKDARRAKEQAHRTIMLQCSLGEAEKADESQIAEQSDDSELTVSDRIQSCDNDDSSSEEYIFADSSEGHKDTTTLRLMAGRTNDVGVEMESSSSLKEAPRGGHCPARKVGLTVLVLVSLLCMGTIWFLNY